MLETLTLEKTVAPENGDPQTNTQQNLFLLADILRLVSSLHPFAG